MQSTRRKVAAAIAAAVAAAIFTIYEINGGSAAVPQVPAPAVQTQPANPVPILSEMHVPLFPGESVGRVDIYGDRYASGQFADGEQVWVYTYASSQTLAAGVERNSTPSDSNKLLVGPSFTVEVIGVDTGSGGISFPESPAALARECGAVVD